MSLNKKPYELSIWKEYLNTQGIKEEYKGAILSTHNMSWLGQAVNIVFTTYLNGTHSLTFELNSRYFDDLVGDYVDNELIDEVYNEVKVKLFYKEEWYEFVVKSIEEEKQVNLYTKKVTCKDAFIEELSRNGYEISFDEELNNNVEELGVLTTEILDGSIWNYAPEYNWGDHTEYIEEKCFKVPVSMFKNDEVPGANLDFSLISDKYVKNYFTGEIRDMELGDDLAAARDGEGGYFWNQYGDNGVENKIDKNAYKSIANDGFIYIPYSQLQFCYISESTTDSDLEATEEPQFFKDTGSYAICPKSVNPKDFIQFIAIPSNAVVEVDESGLLVNKEYHYIMTIEQWNNSVDSKYFYKFQTQKKEYFKVDASRPLSQEDKIQGNYAIGYKGYLDKIGSLDVANVKKISISDRTELNVTKDIDSYVKVYNTLYDNVADFKFEANDYDWDSDYSDARICSKTVTRMITPELARNLCQNGEGIKNTTGWEVMKTDYSVNNEKVSLSISYLAPSEKQYDDIIAEQLNTVIEGLKDKKRELGAIILDASNEKLPMLDSHADTRTIVNFGPSSLDEVLEPNQVYCFSLKIDEYIKETDEKAYYRSKYSLSGSAIDLSEYTIKIGEGHIISNGNYSLTNEIIIPLTGKENNTEKYILFKSNKKIKNPYITITVPKGKIAGIKSCQLFKAYTKGKDCFNNGYFLYSGRDIIENANLKLNETYSKEYLSDKILFSTDIMDVVSGENFEYNKYFIQRGKVKNTDKTFKTLGKKSVFGTDPDKSIFDESLYSESECEIQTLYFDMTSCPNYNSNATNDQSDCNYNGSHHCLYQKYGYCPYHFETEKHCRKIRTLSAAKSNRFNLTQEIGKIFELYPMYITEHKRNGAIKLDEQGKPIKRMFYIKEKGLDNPIGFRYGINLNDIQRNIQSDEIVTKLYVEDVDSEVAKGGMCSIKLAEDNVSKDSFIINFDYYIKKGLIDKEMITADLYGVDEQDLGYLQTLGYLNQEYDKYTNKIINLTNNALTKNEANLEINLNGIIAANKEINKISQQMDSYEKLTIKTSKTLYTTTANITTTIKNSFNQTLVNYYSKYNELKGTINSLIKDTFITEKIDNGITYYYYDSSSDPVTELSEAIEYINENKIDNGAYSTLDNFKESDEYKLHKHKFGLLGQYNEQQVQIDKWKKSRAKILKQIKKLSKDFFAKYESFLKEGTWTDSNYLTNDAYYFGALNVAKDSSIPKVEYTINVIDVQNVPGYEDYIFNVADTTFVEDSSLFGINQDTGRANKLKTLISEITNHLDEPILDTIKVQNFTTQFEDLFQQVTAAVQSVTLNENIYKRASNFSPNKAIQNDSLQGALDTNELTLLSTEDNNLTLDKAGTSGEDMNNHTCKYKITGEGIYFTTNGGESWDVGVGPTGINADYINVGTLDAGKVRIVDSDYVYFLWDKGGIYAYQQPTTDDSSESKNNYALFNRYGLSLVENGKIRLRTGYSFNGKTTGEDAGLIISENKQGENLGFYLYNNNGQPIFSTYTGTSKDNEDDDSAKLVLQGEIFVSDEITTEGEDETTYLYKANKKQQSIKFTQTQIYHFLFQNDANNKKKRMGTFPYLNSDDTIKNHFGVSNENMDQLNAKQRNTQLLFVNDQYYYNDFTTKTSKYQITNKTINLRLTAVRYFMNPGYRVPEKINNTDSYQIYKLYIYNIQYSYTQQLSKMFSVGDTSETSPEDLVTAAKTEKNSEKSPLILYSNQPLEVKTLEGLDYLDRINQEYPLEVWIDYSSRDNVLVVQQKGNYNKEADYNMPYDKVIYYTLGSNPVQNSKFGEQALLSTRTSDNFYFDQTTFIAYPEQEKIQKEDSSITEGKTELYINNSNILNDENKNEDSYKQRLFSCIRRNSEQTQNIFSIRKGGDLYFGGTINIPEDSELLPSEIEIENPSMSIIGQNFYIDFNNLMDMNTKEDIISLISRKIAGANIGYHKHTISTLTLQYEGDDSIYFPSANTIEDWVNNIAGNSVTPIRNAVRGILSKIIGLQANGEGNSSTKANDIKVPNFSKKITFNASGSETDGAGSTSTGTSAIVYVDPIQ